MNVYRSVSREQVEQYLYKLLDPMLRDFVAVSYTHLDVYKRQVLIILTFPSFLTQKEINGTHIRSTPSIVSIRSQKIKRNLPETRQKGGGTAAKWYAYHFDTK